jgi:tRNA nucleotidyltransferase/poly(A) polymerase
VLRAIGEANHRFEEDHLRMLRAARFAARFHLQIEQATAQAIRAHFWELQRISPERIAGELRIMLTAPTAAAAWNLLEQLNLLRVIFRWWPQHEQQTRIARIGLVYDEPPTFGLVLATAMLMFWPRNDDPVDILRYLERRSVAAAADMAHRLLKITNHEWSEMDGILTGIHAMLATPQPTVAAKKRFLARSTSSLARRLMRLLAKSAFFTDQVESLERDFAVLEHHELAPTPLITGGDLTAAGLQPGPLFKRILGAVYDEQLEGHISGREQALELALRLAKGQ